MKSFLLILAGTIPLSSCDTTRLFERNHDFEHRYWLVNDRPVFEFTIDDPSMPYNLYLNLRNESNFQTANLYFTYSLLDSNKTIQSQKMVSEFLFDQKTGEPLGRSGLGDLYDHQFPLIREYIFPSAGTYYFQVEQFMRTDTLRGVLSVGLRVEKAESD